jgi:hypothetical protein
MKFSKRTKYMLLGSIMFLGFAFRYPFTPHEIGWDSFFIHQLINSLNHTGYPGWWIHPFSTFGLTPLSYASAVPVLLSGFSQACGLTIEDSILLFCFICFILGVLGSYMVAKIVFNNDIYIFLVVFGFSTSEIFIDYTNWTISTRGLFITFLPIFLFLLFKRSNKMIYHFMVIIIFVYLVAIHHLYSFLIFPLISYFIIVRAYPFKNVIQEKNIKKVIILFSILILIIIPLLIIFDIFTEFFYTGISNELLDQPKINWIEIVLRNYGRNLGIIGFFGIIGYFLLLRKQNKNLNEILLLIFVVVLLPFILIVTYMAGFISIFVYLLAGFGIFYIFKAFNQKRMRRFAQIALIFVFILSLVFTGYYTLTHPGSEPRTKYNERYLEEVTYDSGLWLKYYVDDGVMYSNDYISSYRISAVFYIKEFPGKEPVQYINGFIEIDELKIVRASPASPHFWSESFYEIESTESTLDWKSRKLKYENYESVFSQEITKQFNIKYIVENDKLLEDQEDGEKRFFVSLNDNCYEIYVNDKLSVRYL